MSSFLFRLGRGCARHPFRTMTVWLLVAVAVFAAKSSFGDELVDDFKVPGVESQQGTDVLKESFPEFSGAAGRVVFHTEDGRIDDAEERALVEEAVATLAATVDDLTLVTSPYDPQSAAISADGTTAFSSLQFSQQTLSKEHFEQVEAAIEGAREAGLQAEISGEVADAGKEVHGNEGIGLIVAMIVLLLAFGSVIAMGLPIVTALLGVGVGMAGVGIMAGFTNVPVVSEMLAMMIGLGVGIDYALFIVTRHRQHLSEGMRPDQAAGHANATAGQSVLFAGTTVVIAIFGLLLAGIPAITTMGFAIGLVVIVSMLIAVTLLPALLGLAGTKIDALRIHRKEETDVAHETLSGKWAHHVGSRPWRYAAISLAVLVALAVPVVSMRIGFADQSNDAEGTTSREASDLLTEGFGPGFTGTLNVVVELPDGDAESSTAVAVAVRDALAATDGVANASGPILSDDGTVAIVPVIATTSPQDEETSDLVEAIREDVLPTVVAGTGAETYVTGATAFQEDLSQQLSERLPIFIAAVVALSFILLMIVFRSVLVPLKAAIMNMLSIGAAYGAIIAVFQWGWGAGIIGLEDTIPVNPFIPLILFAILFGLSMDYEVFLLSRVREEFLKTGDSHRSVVEGLGSTARVITSAALIMISVFGAFIWTEDVMVQMFGLGLAVAVLVDATIVRMVLVPATMALLGGANWWLPGWLDRILPHLDLEGGPTGVELDEDEVDEVRELERTAA
jgi:putative drug exporter of the RND superfamily